VGREDCIYGLKDVLPSPGSRDARRRGDGGAPGLVEAGGFTDDGVDADMLDLFCRFYVSVKSIHGK